MIRRPPRSTLFPTRRSSDLMHLLHSGDLAAIASLISIFFLFNSYQKSHAASDLYYSFLFIGAGSLLFPQLTFFSVLWLLEAQRFQSLNLRSFCAAILGWMTPYWLLFGHAFFYDRMELFYRPFIELATRSEERRVGKECRS